MSNINLSTTSISESQADMQERKAWELLEEHSANEVTPLQDQGSSGKERPWNQKAAEKEKVAHLFDLLGMHYRGDKIIDCGSWLKYLQCSSFPHEHPKALAKASFCKDKFCSMCNWRRSRRYTQQLDELLTVVNEREPGLGWVFLTLTVRNVHCLQDGYSDTNALQWAIDDLFKSWNNFASDRQFKKRVKGWIRALEVTINNDVNDCEWYGSYHPHFHVLLAVDRKEYFKKDSQLYLETEDWVELWKRCARLDYDPIVDARRVKKIQSFEEMAQVEADKLDKIKSPVLEVAKYPLKMTDVWKDARYQKLRNGKRRLVRSWEIGEMEAKRRLWHLHIALDRRRLLGFGGLIRKIRQELKQQDVESKNADLVHTDNGHEMDLCNCPTCGAIRKIWLYRWTKEGYIHGGK